MALASIFLGFGGVALLALPSGGTSGRMSPMGLTAGAAGAFLWALGSMFSRRARVPASPLVSVGLQMIVGGALMMLASFPLGEWSRLDLSRVSLRSALGMGYLVLFGSIIAYSAYIWLLKNADPTWVSTYAFVNPVVAVFLGWLIADERLTSHALAATVVIVVAVGLLTLARARESGAIRAASSGSAPSR
jgi:drug/metabolite transporter (DMT)-like permease